MHAILECLYYGATIAQVVIVLRTLHSDQILELLFLQLLCRHVHKLLVQGLEFVLNIKLIFPDDFLVVDRLGSFLPRHLISTHVLKMAILLVEQELAHFVCSIGRPEVVFGTFFEMLSFL